MSTFGPAIATPVPWFPQIVLAPPSGVLAAGYKLFSYAAGTTTKQDTYTDYTMSTPNSNPIVLNSSGMPAAGMYLDSGKAYKLVLALPTDTDPPASPLATQDNVWSGAAMTSPYARRLYFDPQTHGSVGAGETDLGSYTVQANTLVTDGQTLRVTWAGSLANNANVKGCKVYFGGTQVASYSWATAGNQGWRVSTEIVRIGVASEFAISLVHNLSQPVQNGTAAVALTGDRIVKLTATGVADNDIVENMMLVELWS